MKKLGNIFAFLKDYGTSILGVSFIFWSLYKADIGQSENAMNDRNLFGKITDWEVFYKTNTVRLKIDTYPHYLDMEVISTEMKKYRKNLEVGDIIAKKKNNDSIWLYKKKGGVQIYTYYGADYRGKRP